MVVEHTFGVLKSRFRCLHKSGGALQYTPSKCAKITLACMLLHNRCIRRNIALPEEEPELEEEEVPVPMQEKVAEQHHPGVE